MSNTMIGRHNVGRQRVNTGKTRSGQSEPASNKGGGITGVAKNNTLRSQAPKPAVLTDAKNLSIDAQKKVVRPPMPFADPQGSLNVKAPSGPRGAKPGMEPKNIYAGKSGTTVGAKANPGGQATGYSKLPNQSYQIGGRMGFPPPARKAGQNGQGYPSKRNAVFFGE